MVVVKLMHEMAIAQGILDIALATALEHQAGVVRRIALLVGEMTEVEPEALKFCFGALAAGTPAASAELTIELVPLTACCRDCQADFDVQRFRFSCPACGSVRVEITGGRELKVAHLEVD